MNMQDNSERTGRYCINRLSKDMKSCQVSDRARMKPADLGFRLEDAVATLEPLVPTVGATEATEFEKLISVSRDGVQGMITSAFYSSMMKCKIW